MCAFWRHLFFENRTGLIFQTQEREEMIFLYILYFLNCLCVAFFIAFLIILDNCDITTSASLRRARYREMYRRLRRNASRGGWFVLRINIFLFLYSFHDVFVKIVKIWFFGALTFPRTATERTHHPPYKRWLRVARLKSWENTGLTFWRLTFSTKDNRKNAPPVLCTVGARRSVKI